MNVRFTGCMPLAFGSSRTLFSGVRDGSGSEKQTAAFWQSTPDKFSAIQFPDSLFRFLPNQQARVLDIGCGWGETVQQFMDHGYPNTEGIDFNEEAVKQAHVLGLGQQVKTGDALNLKASDGSFDAVILQATLAALPNREAVGQSIAEASRVLKSGGRIFILDWAIDPQRYGREYEAGTKAGYPYGTFEVTSPTDGSFMFLSHHFSDDQLYGWLRDSGFVLPPVHHQKTVTRLTQFDGELSSHVLVAEKR